MKQNEHLFQFTGRAIAQAAERERDYHKTRLNYWRAEQDKQVGLAKDLRAIIRVSEYPVTGGKRVSIVADIAGVQEINTRLTECGSKIDWHRSKADEYHLKASAYATQPERSYELDPADVQYFRLAGGDRDD